MSADNLPALTGTTDEDFGPAMLAISPRHRAFVMGYFEAGANATEAARLAGYEDNDNGSIKVTAYRLVHRPAIVKAIQEEARRRLAAGGLPVAVKAVIDIASNPQHKDQAKAAAMIMDRAGVHATVEKNVNVNVTLTRAEKEAEIRQMAEELGLDPAKLLGTVTIDAEYTEIPTQEDEKW